MRPRHNLRELSWELLSLGRRDAFAWPEVDSVVLNMVFVDSASAFGGLVELVSIPGLEGLATEEDKNLDADALMERQPRAPFTLEHLTLVKYWIPPSFLPWSLAIEVLKAFCCEETLKDCAKDLLIDV